MIPFIDLKSQFARVESEVRNNIDKVLSHGQYIMGPEVKELEKKLAEYAGTDYCITCASGTDALLMSLMAKGVEAGDLIFTTPFTFIASAEVIAFLGAIPVFVDVDPETFNMDPQCLKKAIEAVIHNDPNIYPLPEQLKNTETSGKMKGIIGVDIFGLPSDYRSLTSLAEENGLFVIEDAAQSFGAEIDGEKTGSLAELGCTSFFPAKPLGCYGDGGAIFTNNEALKDTLESIRIHGFGNQRYEHVRIGITGRLDSLQAAILLPKLDILNDEMAKRQQVVELYKKILSRNPQLSYQLVPKGYKSAWAQYTVLAPNAESRDEIVLALKDSEIPSAIYYPIPLHTQKVFSYLNYQEQDFPVTYNLSQRVFSLPMHPYLDKESIEKIATTVLDAL